ncbi:MAG TPA: hypothetical protein VHX37_12160 [Acidobacteriaceae bacterium]|jgi:hypothetical protein|nr:hypothetical protein [Acidobacteriaceae bacterium]
MQPNRLGRVLGVGTRLAADKLRQKAEQAGAAPAAGQAARPAASAPGSPAASGAGYVEGSRRLARGAGRFGASMWRPFALASGVLWLQITGVFFALFTLFFVVHASQVYKVSGWRDRHMLAYGLFAVLFCWFAVTSFWRAHRRQKKF